MSWNLAYLDTPPLDPTPLLFGRYETNGNNKGTPTHPTKVFKAECSMWNFQWVSGTIVWNGSHIGNDLWNLNPGLGVVWLDAPTIEALRVLDQSGESCGTSWNRCPPNPTFARDLKWREHWNIAKVGNYVNALPETFGNWGIRSWWQLKQIRRRKPVDRRISEPSTVWKISEPPKM